MGEPIRVRLSRQDERAVREAAERENISVSEYVRTSLKPVVARERATIIQQARLWWIQDVARPDIIARIEALEKQLAEAERAPPGPRAPRFLHTIYENHTAQTRAEIARLRERLADLTDQEQRILHPTATVIPMIVLLQTLVTPNTTNNTLPPSIASAPTESGVSMWVWILAIVVAAVAAYALHVYIKKRNLSLSDFKPKKPARSANDDEDEVYASAEERERKFDWNPYFLRQRLDTFLAQERSEEKIRQFCEDTDFQALDDNGQAITMRFYPLREEQIKRIPLNVQFDILSARTRGRLPPSDQMFTTPAAENGNGNGRTTVVVQPPRGPGRPPGSRNKPKPTESASEDPEGAEN